jgi:hypothetical protein
VLRLHRDRVRRVALEDARHRLAEIVERAHLDPGGAEDLLDLNPAHQEMS